MNIRRILLTIVASFMYWSFMLAAEPWRVVMEEIGNDSISCYIDRGSLTSAKCMNPRKILQNDTEDCLEIHTSSPGQLESLLDKHINTVDSLVIHGPIDSTDLYTMWKASFYGKLKAINLENSDIAGERIPDMAFWHQEEQLEPGGEYIDCINLRRIILPDNIKEIGENAFSYAINMEYINLPSSLRTIGEAAFSDCISLKTDPLIIPEGVEKISDYLFLNCEALKGTIVLPSTIREIGDGAFFQTKISSINFPENLRKIEAAAFYACRLKEVQLPESCQDLYSTMIFQLNLELESMRLPEGMEYIPSSFASVCLKLSSVNIPSSVKYLDDYAFWQCRSLKYLELPPTLESIGADSLWYLDSLEKITFPSTLKFIGAESCMYWANIKQIYCMATEPPLCEYSERNPDYSPFGKFGSTFDMRTPQDTPVYVPLGSSEKYRIAWGWDYFTNFIETDFSGIPECFEENENNNAVIYDLLGQKISDPLPGHLYIQNGRKIVF